MVFQWAVRVCQRLQSRFGQSGAVRELNLVQIVEEVRHREATRADPCPLGRIHYCPNVFSFWKRRNTPDFQRFFLEKRPWKRFCTNVLIRGKWIHSTDIDGNKVLGQWCCSRNSSPEQSSPENIARFLVSKVGPATGVRNAGRRTDFRDKQSRDISGEIFLERNHCPRTGFSGSNSWKNLSHPVKSWCGSRAVGCPIGREVTARTVFCSWKRFKRRNTPRFRRFFLEKRPWKRFVC